MPFDVFRSWTLPIVWQSIRPHTASGTLPTGRISAIGFWNFRLDGSYHIIKATTRQNLFGHGLSPELMLIFVTTCLILFAGISLAILLKKLSNQRPLADNDPKVRLDAETYRPLFAPTDEDLRLAEAEEREQLTAKHEEDECLKIKERLAKLEVRHRNWSKSPNRAATAELLRDAPHAYAGDAFADLCEEISNTFRDGKLTDVSPKDLAALLESHFWLLPAEQRTPGASFRIKEIVASLNQTRNSGVANNRTSKDK